MATETMTVETTETVAAKKKPEKKKKQKKMHDLSQQQARAGWLFISPFIFGVCMFFIIPLFKSFWYSLTDVQFVLGGTITKWNDFGNYVEAFRGDVDFLPMLGTSLGNILWQVPVIIIFSMFIALILNQKFRGRVFARAVFFLPVIVTSGIIISIINNDYYAGQVEQGGQTASMFSVGSIQTILMNSGFSDELINLFVTIADNIFNITWKSGVQILLFLAGLQSVPGQLYEAAKVEGATGWETFWKITFPMITPQIIINVTYSVVDSFTDYENEVMQYVYDLGFFQMRYGYSSAVAWIFFICIIAILGVVNFALNKIAFYQVD